MTYNATHPQAKVRLLRQSSSGLVDFGDSRSCSCCCSAAPINKLESGTTADWPRNLVVQSRVAGRTLNIYCSGEGSPTVIFERDCGFPGYSWLHIQREIAKFTRARRYDRRIWLVRSGAMEKAHIAPPYVLAAHAIGAFHALVFRRSYPNEVEGMVLIDPTSEDLTIPVHNHIELFRRLTPKPGAGAPVPKLFHKSIPNTIAER